MSTAAVSSPPDKPAPSPILDPLAALLSYLVPGLGQLYQGRFAKGILFFVCLYGLFFYGMNLGQWKNVYIQYKIPNTEQTPRMFDWSPAKYLWARLQFVGQFWIGVAAWPAVMQFNDIPVPFNKEFQKTPTEDELNVLQQRGDKTWDLAWVYTVIAGVLNVLVIYDALAGPAFAHVRASPASTAPDRALKEAVA